jgi:hypothetical protein
VFCFGSSAAPVSDREGNEQSILSNAWMFPGMSASAIQQAGNPVLRK